MKKSILIFALILASFAGFSQATPSTQFRVATLTTAFGQNLPVGSTVWCAADSTTWDVTKPCISTLNLTTALAEYAVDLHIKSTGSNTGDQILTVAGDINNAHMTIGGTAADTVGITGAGINVVSVSGKGITITGTEVDGDITNEGQLTIAAGSASTSVLHSNTSGSTDITITAGTGLTITEDGTSGFTLASTVSARAYFTESWEVATTGSSDIEKTLAHTPIIDGGAETGITVSLNGYELTASQYTAATDKITVSIPVYKYDRITVSYTY
jgi:hypothetical protein